MVVGYIVTYCVGGFTPANIAQVRGSAFIALPHFQHPGWSFNIALLLPFMVAIICSTLKNVGDITTCQKINDANWKRLDMTPVRGGILADGLASVLAGCIGGVGQASYSANIGLSVATGVTSRYVAFFTGALFAALAFFPKLTAVLAIMPRPVMGAILIFAISFMILAGLQIMMSRMIDSRKTFVIGLSLIFGLSTSMIPNLYAGITPALRPVFMSPLSLATVLVVLLNLLLRIGTSRRAEQSICPGKDSAEEIHNFMEYQGGVWGAPRDVIMRAESALQEFFESAAANRLSEGSVKVGLYYDELNLDVDLEYAGVPMDYPNLRPSTTDILEDEGSLVRLSGFLIRKYVDRMKAGSENGICRVQLHFDN
jgi:NCS2 family nucleobase:cation symporter-2